MSMEALFSVVKKFSLLFLTIFSFNLFGQDEIVDCSCFLSQDRFPAGSSGKIAISCKVDEGYHITDPSLGLFKIEFPKTEFLIFAEPEYPKPEPYKDTFIYRDLKIFADFYLSKDARPGDISVEIKLRYQLCEEEPEEKCLLPSVKKINISIPVAPEGSSFKYINKEIFKGKIKVKPEIDTFSIFSIIAVFFSGILTGLTPCIYPLYPLVIAFVGGSSIRRRIDALILSIFIILGLSLSFSTLGFISAKTGSAIGVITRSPIFLSFVSLIFFAMALSMFGAFDIKLPPSFLGKIQKKRSGIFGAFFMGIIFGLIGIPCVGPLLVSLLTFVAKSQNPFLGFALLFSYALGIGIIFIPLSLFASLRTLISSTGEISSLIKYLFGLILLSASFYFLKDSIPEKIYFLILGIVLIFLSVFAGVFRREEEGLRGKILKGAGVIILIIGIFYLFLSLTSIHKIKLSGESKVSEIKGVNWLQSFEDGLKIAKEEGKFVLIDFYASWCTVCKELDLKTFSNERVIESLKDFVPVRIDVSDGNREELRKFNVYGLPTVIFLDSSGNEMGRFSGFKNPQDFLNEIQKVKSRINE